MKKHTWDNRALGAAALALAGLMAFGLGACGKGGSPGGPTQAPGAGAQTTAGAGGGQAIGAGVAPEATQGAQGAQGAQGQLPEGLVDDSAALQEALEKAAMEASDVVKEAQAQAEQATGNQGVEGRHDASLVGYWEAVAVDTGDGTRRDTFLGMEARYMLLLELYENGAARSMTQGIEDRSITWRQLDDETIEFTPANTSKPVTARLQGGEMVYELGLDGFDKIYLEHKEGEIDESDVPPFMSDMQKVLESELSAMQQSALAGAGPGAPVPTASGEQAQVPGLEGMPTPEPDAGAIADRYRGDWSGVAVITEAGGVFAPNLSARAGCAFRFALGDDGQGEAYACIDQMGDAAFAARARVLAEWNSLQLVGTYMGVPLDTAFYEASPGLQCCTVDYVSPDNPQDKYTMTFYLRKCGEAWSDDDPFRPGDAVEGKAAADVVAGYGYDVSKMPSLD
jgi:hypothetical protein